MKIRLTLGNVFGAVLGGAAWIAGHSDVIGSIVPAKYSTPLLGIAAAVLFFTKGGATSSAALIPEAKKVEAGPLVLERTGPLKPQTP